MNKHTIKLHGVFAEKYGVSQFNMTAGSITNLFRLIFKNALPTFLDNEKNFTVVFEDVKGNFTEVYDPEQILPQGKLTVHILPNPDGAWVQIVYYIIVAIVAAGVAILLAPKVKFNEDSASGAVWTSAENVIGQGGVIPVLLGKRLVGSRVASHGIDSNLYVDYNGYFN